MSSAAIREQSIRTANLTANCSSMLQRGWFVTVLYVVLAVGRAEASRPWKQLPTENHPAEAACKQLRKTLDARYIGNDLSIRRYLKALAPQLDAQLVPAKQISLGGVLLFVPITKIFLVNRRDGGAIDISYDYMEIDVDGSGKLRTADLLQADRGDILRINKGLWSRNAGAVSSSQLADVFLEVGYETYAFYQPGASVEWFTYGYYIHYVQVGGKPMFLLESTVEMELKRYLAVSFDKDLNLSVICTFDLKREG